MATTITQIHFETGGGGANRFHRPYSQYVHRNAAPWKTMATASPEVAIIRDDEPTPAASTPSGLDLAGTALKTEYATNARSKCQLCKTKLIKDAWRFQLAVADPYSGSGRVTWQSAHASCYLRNVHDGLATRPTTQSMPYHGAAVAPGWSAWPPLALPDSDVGRAVVTAMVTVATDAVSAQESLNVLLPAPDLRACFDASLDAAVPGASALEGDARTALALFALSGGRLSGLAAQHLNSAESSEATLPQPDDNGDPLRGKFTQYSPNSQAHCRDCQARLVEGEIRVGANVFSSSSRHAGFAVNYWCLDCMCAKPAVQRAARLCPQELCKVLPGAELLAAADVDRVCALLGCAAPSAGDAAAMAAGRKRATRSGRKFGTWGEPHGGGGGGDGNGGGDGGGDGPRSLSSKRQRN
jgi:hypothetical protein